MRERSVGNQPGVPRSQGSSEPHVETPSRILIAEDEHLVATDLTLTLAELGFTIIGPATDGEAALNLARTAYPDLVLMDIRMPKRDGLSAAKEMFGELGIPVVILSAYTDAPYLADARDAGVFGYLVKPVHAKQLKACIDVAWHQFRTHLAEKAVSAQLRQRLEDRKVIERAKWVLVRRRSIGEEDAMKLLQREARDTQQTVVSVASAILRADVLM